MLIATIIPETNLNFRKAKFDILVIDFMSYHQGHITFYKKILSSTCLKEYLGLCGTFFKLLYLSCGKLSSGNGF